MEIMCLVIPENNMKRIIISFCIENMNQYDPNEKYSLPLSLIFLDKLLGSKEKTFGKK